jgi:hypothetical protein
LRCPAGFSSKCGYFVAWFLDICDVLPPAQQTVDVLSHCYKPSKFTRSKCHNLGWTDNLSTLRWNVTVVKCHSRWFVGWMLSLGWNVTWSVCGWTDRQCTAADIDLLQKSGLGWYGLWVGYHLI